MLAVGVLRSSGGESPDDRGGYVDGMAYDRDLANRVRECIGSEADLDERQMFGGLAFPISRVELGR